MGTRTQVWTFFPWNIWSANVTPLSLGWMLPWRCRSYGACRKWCMPTLRRATPYRDSELDPQRHDERRSHADSEVLSSQSLASWDVTQSRTVNFRGYIFRFLGGGGL